MDRHPLRPPPTSPLPPLCPATATDFHRILVWLFAALGPNGPRAATTNTARFLRSVLDPATEWRDDFPATDHQLRKLVAENYIPVFAGLLCVLCDLCV